MSRTSRQILLQNLPAIVSQLPGTYRKELSKFVRAKGEISIRLLETLERTNEAIGQIIIRYEPEIMARVEELTSLETRLAARRKISFRDALDRIEAAKQWVRLRDFFCGYFKGLGLEVDADSMNVGQVLGLYQHWQIEHFKDLQSRLIEIIRVLSRSEN
ncbi:MAG: hypothetical protein HYT46_01500 [Candidatus Vogelbacteria bacterium]|nr:hypothetical protein [Candidatus Vogelbacteria bacterium]